jgi:hypothetical protein
LDCQLTGLSKPVITTAYAFQRVMCRRYFENNLIKTGGDDAVCKVDESMFAYKA